METHSNEVIIFCISNMVLDVHSDAYYLSSDEVRSCVGKYFFLGILPINKHPISFNGNIHITCAILKLVAISEAEAELGAFFFNAYKAQKIYE